MAKLLLPLFDGGGDDPELWLESMEEYFEYSQISMDLYVKVAFHHLRGIADEWARKNELTISKNWCAFSYNLLWEFDPTKRPVHDELEVEQVDIHGNKSIADESHDAIRGRYGENPNCSIEKTGTVLVSKLQELCSSVNLTETVTISGIEKHSSHIVWEPVDKATQTQCDCGGRSAKEQDLLFLLNYLQLPWVVQAYGLFLDLEVLKRVYRLTGTSNMLSWCFDPGIHNTQVGRPHISLLLGYCLWRRHDTQVLLRSSDVTGVLSKVLFLTAFVLGVSATESRCYFEGDISSFVLDSSSTRFQQNDVDFPPLYRYTFFNDSCLWSSECQQGTLIFKSLELISDSRHQYLSRDNCMSKTTCSDGIMDIFTLAYTDPTITIDESTYIKFFGGKMVGSYLSLRSDIVQGSISVIMVQGQKYKATTVIDIFHGILLVVPDVYSFYQDYYGRTQGKKVQLYDTTKVTLR